MSTATAIRLQVEAALAHRIPSALTPRARMIRPVVPTGVPVVDELVDGGLPVGAISEFVGPACSGRTSLALSFMARLTRGGRVVAWVDVRDEFDPESAAAAGVDLTRLLWVRCGGLARQAAPGKEPAFRLPEKYMVAAEAKKGLHGGGFGPHPRTEMQGISQAVSELFHPDVAPLNAEAQRRPREEGGRGAMQVGGQAAGAFAKRKQPVNAAKPWARIEQGLRVADLLLQAGGFAAIVLDMAGIAPEHSTRVPMATWFRYRAASERAQTSLVLLTQHACAKSSAELLLRFEAGSACRDEATVFTGMEHRVEVDRSRFTQSDANVIPMRKPPRRESGATWRSQSSWAGAR